MGRHKGYKHSEATKRKIAMRTKEALSGGVAVAATEQQKEIARRVAFTFVAAAKAEQAKELLASEQEDKAAHPKDALDALAAGPLENVLQLMLWVNRHNEPELTAQITDRDLSEFHACIEYLHVVPQVRIVRPQGMPGHDLIPATRTRSAIPAAEPTPPKPFVTVCLVEKNTENAIRPIESTEQGWQAAEEAKNFAHARDNALRLAAELQRAAATGDYSSSVLNDAAMCLAALAR